MARDSKGRFKKGHRGGKARRSRSTAIARRSGGGIVVVGAAPKRRGGGRRRRRGAFGGGGGLSLRSLGPPLLAGAALGWVVHRGGKKGGAVEQIVEFAKKVPGQKTFGTAPALGVLALGIDRFIYRHRYLRLLGVTGLIIGAYDAGAKGQDLKWLGNVGDADDGMAVR